MDRREMRHRWFQFDEKRMTITLTTGDDSGDDTVLEIPAKFEVCGTCDGKGSHVNPSIDSNGLSADDFAEDPGFAEDYFSGVYDQPCNECGGRRVVPVPDEGTASPESIKAFEDRQEEYYQDQVEQWHERRMGY